MPTVEMTTLENGMRVVSQNTLDQVTSLGLFVDAGSKYENDNSNGVSHFMEAM